MKNRITIAELKPRKWNSWVLRVKRGQYQRLANLDYIKGERVLNMKTYHEYYNNNQYYIPVYTQGAPESFLSPNFENQTIRTHAVWNDIPPK